ncbi:MAG: polyprenyl synthetase family protein [Mucinivorans sp.]
MSENIKDLSVQIEAELAVLKDKLRATIASPFNILGPIATSLVGLRGKMMRPLLGMLVAKLHTGQVSEKAYATAVLFELLHHATLVHDDVIDEAYLRRGEATLGAMLRSRSAVLVGDFLFAKGLTAAANAGAFQEIAIATRSIERVVEGELTQSENQRCHSLSQSDYINMVRLKTSSLLSGVAQASALASGASADEQQAMYDLGDALGVAFQIQDDILDYVGSKATGKALYNDIREGKITLPLMLAVERGGNKSEVLADLRAARVEKIVEYVKTNDGVQAASAVMHLHHDKAIAILGRYPASAVRSSLIDYADYVINRTK